MCSRRDEGPEFPLATKKWPNSGLFPSFLWADPIWSQWKGKGSGWSVQVLGSVKALGMLCCVLEVLGHIQRG